MIKNFDAYERILVIGDSHGEFNRLMSLYKKLNVTDRDFLIFLGDYVDRGKDNVKVLKWKIKGKKYLDEQNPVDFLWIREKF